MTKEGRVEMLGIQSNISTIEFVNYCISLVELSGCMPVKKEILSCARLVLVF